MHAKRSGHSVQELRAPGYTPNAEPDDGIRVYDGGLQHSQRDSDLEF